MKGRRNARTLLPMSTGAGIPPFHSGGMHASHSVGPERLWHMSHQVRPHPISVRERVLSASGSADRLGQDCVESVRVVLLLNNGNRPHPITGSE